MKTQQWLAVVMFAIIFAIFEQSRIAILNARLDLIEETIKHIDKIDQSQNEAMLNVSAALTTHNQTFESVGETLTHVNASIVALDKRTR